MKRQLALLLILSCVIACTGCDSKAYEIPLKQAESEIKSISFVVNESDMPQTVYVAETDSQITEIVQSIQHLEIGRFYNDPSTSYGKRYIEICYQNGDIEIIGTDMIEYISTDGTIEESYGGWYYAKMESMLELFQKYIS